MQISDFIAQNPKILVVDDLKSARKILRKLLAQLGFVDIQECENGAEALDYFGKTSVDLIISDWEMPELTGLGLLKAVRTSNRKVPFLLITSHADLEFVKEAGHAGVSAYVLKPFSPEMLEDKIVEAYEKSLITEG